MGRDLWPPREPPGVSRPFGSRLLCALPWAGLLLSLGGCAALTRPQLGPALAPARVLVSCLQDHAVWVLDPLSLQRIGAPLALPEGPSGMAARGGEVYVALMGRPYLSVLGGGDFSEQRRIGVGAGCGELVFSPDGLELAATLPSSGELVRISARTGQVEGRVELGGQPYGIAWSEDGGQLYVSNPGKGSLQRVDRETGEVAEVRVGLGPRGVLAVDGQVLVALHEEDAVVEVRFGPGGVGRRFRVGGGPFDLVPTGGGVLVSLPEEGALASLDLTTGVCNTTPLGAGVSGLAISEDRQFLFGACESAGEVAVLGLHDGTVVGRIPLPAGARPRDCVWVPGGQAPAAP